MLKITDLGFTYGLGWLIKDLSFELKAGQLVQLSGPNGSGKTTLLKIIVGLLRASKGNVAVTVPDASCRADVMEYLPSEANCFYGKLSAVGNLKFFAELRGKHLSNDVIGTELNNWGLSKTWIMEELWVERFSTGMRRRLALARLNLANVPLWILDEPLYGLDSSGFDVFHQTLKRHVERGGSAIMVSHDETIFSDLPVTKLAMKSGGGA
ncbi:MAG: heme ABC exporter ATP-binding protein CcmA [Oligoflexales bacterium]